MFHAYRFIEPRNGTRPRYGPARDVVAYVNASPRSVEGTSSETVDPKPPPLLNEGPLCLWTSAQRDWGLDLVARLVHRERDRVFLGPST